jgi:hypothetical protein
MMTLWKTSYTGDQRKQENAARSRALSHVERVIIILYKCEGSRGSLVVPPRSPSTLCGTIMHAYTYQEWIWGRSGADHLSPPETDSLGKEMCLCKDMKFLGRLPHWGEPSKWGVVSTIGEDLTGRQVDLARR